MSTIIIGTGLSKGVLSPQHRFLSTAANIGTRESARLLGTGRTFGEGPLPAYLRLAMEAQSAGTRVGLVLVQPDPKDDGDQGSSDESDFVEPLEEVIGNAEVVQATSNLIPWEALLKAAARQSGRNSTADLTTGDPVRFLVVGCHTERQILAIATFLRKMLGCPDVAVSSHLVGSSTQEAHLATLRHTLPGLDVQLLLDLCDAAEYAGLDAGSLAPFGARPCLIEPEETRDKLAEHQRHIIERLCLHWTRTELRPLAGGFSGSLLFLANGWKGEAHTEPMVIKIDDRLQMRRELDGYYQVKDFFGKQVPTFGYPVGEQDLLGVGMELAAMEGLPETLQDTFETAEDEDGVAHFMARLDKALNLASNKLYRNTSEQISVAPFRQFGVHTEQQIAWLKENSECALSYVSDAPEDVPAVDVDQIAALVRLIAGNPDSLESAVCLVHGDLNLANVICDDGDNIWFIDWTHSRRAPVETDFAKIENDLKFVMSKAFDVADLPRLQRFEEFLVAHPLPPGVRALPEELKFVKWDLRFRKILEAVRRVRQGCFDVKETEDWLIYRVALLRYALHTLSFDKKREKGECDPAQLMHALYSVEQLAFNLLADDFHLKIRAEGPALYPKRQRIPIDEAPWVLDCPDYAPPYFVAPDVLRSDVTLDPGGWADPEDISILADELPSRGAKRFDDNGRPLNPRGRTGLAGRGLLGLWGANLSVAVTAIRVKHGTSETEVLLGSREGETDLDLPKGFVLPNETPETCLPRVLTSETGWSGEGASTEIVFEGYTYDPRQTDHAWVESRAYMIFDQAGEFPDYLHPGGAFDELKWRPLSAATINRVPSGQARFIHEGLKRLLAAELIDRELGERLLART